MSFGPTVTLVSGVARSTRAALALYPVVRIPASIVFSVAVAVFYRAAARENTYNMLWAVLFGFATLNILGLAARRMEPRRGLSFGEVMAVLTVFLAVFLLGWEMLSIFHIFPIRLR
jgi:cytochrome bd-type quinol oxidase subunit 2